MAINGALLTSLWDQTAHQHLSACLAVLKADSGRAAIMACEPMRLRRGAKFWSALLRRRFMIRFFITDGFRRGKIFGAKKWLDTPGKIIAGAQQHINTRNIMRHWNETPVCILAQALVHGARV